jgi:hypothetical protein
MEIQVYNHLHNGDLFFSRGLIQLLSQRYKIKLYHNNNTPIFSDLSYVEEIKGVPLEFLPETDSSQIANLGVINTWIGQGGLHYHRRHPYGCTYENYFAIITDVANYLNLNISNIEDYLPSVNFQNLEHFDKIKTIMEDYKKSYKKIIFVSNGDVLSEQSLNFDFTEIVDGISSKYDEYLFLLSKKTDLIRDNVIYTDDITKVTPDLLYISLISLYCDVIIGRDSGPYCFTHVKENILNPNKKYICFSGNRDSGKFYSKSKVDFVWSNNYNINNIINTIEYNI